MRFYSFEKFLSFHDKEIISVLNSINKQEMDFTRIYAFYIQISGILIALVAVIALYRIDQIKTYLIGLGANVHKRVLRTKDIMKDKAKETTEEVPKDNKFIMIKDKFINRLQGAVDVKSVEGIEEIIIRLTIKECKVYPDKEKRNKTSYYKQAWPFWKATIQLLKSIKQLFILAMVLVFITLALSIIALIFEDPVNSCTFFSLISIFMIMSLISIAWIVKKSFFTKLPYEVKKHKKCKKLRIKHPEIDKPY